MQWQLCAICKTVQLLAKMPLPCHGVVVLEDGVHLPIGLDGRRDVVSWVYLSK